MAYPRLLPGRPFFTKGMPGITSGILTIMGELFISAGNEPDSHASHGYLVTAARGLCASGTCFAPTEAER